MQMNFDQEQGSLEIVGHCQNVFFVNEKEEELSVNMIDNEFTVIFEGKTYKNKDGELVPNKKKNNEETVNDKVRKLLELTKKFPFVEIDPYKGTYHYKIENEYKNYENSTEFIFLGRTEEGFDKIIDRAIQIIEKEKDEYENLPF